MLAGHSTDCISPARRPLAGRTGARDPRRAVSPGASGAIRMLGHDYPSLPNKRLYACIYVNGTHIPLEQVRNACRAVTATGAHGTDDLDSAGRHKVRARRFAATLRLFSTGFPVPGQFTGRQLSRRRADYRPGPGSIRRTSRPLGTSAHRGSDLRRRGASPDPGRSAIIRHQRPGRWRPPPAAPPAAGGASVQPRPVTPGHTPPGASFLIRSQPFR